MVEHATLLAATVPLCCLVLAYGAIHDVVARTIPDQVAGAVAASGLLAATLCHTLFVSALIATAIFFLGFLAYRFGLLGGGDVKLMAAASLVVSPTKVPLQLEAIALAGGALALVYLVAGRLAPAPAPQRPPGTLGRATRIELWRIHRGAPLPYGVAIALGTSFLLVGR